MKLPALIIILSGRGFQNNVINSMLIRDDLCADSMVGAGAFVFIRKGRFYRVVTFRHQFLRVESLLARHYGLVDGQCDGCGADVV